MNHENLDKLILELKAGGIKVKQVLDAISKIDRRLFVPSDLEFYAYDNSALLIGEGQTISQPYTVARMLELLELEPSQKILEIGAGSGYNAALLAFLAGEIGRVYSMEIKKDLCLLARKNLTKAGIKNVVVVGASGYNGYKEEAPYDRIIATAGSNEIPEALIGQLKPGGILIIPITQNESEIMTKVKKEKDGELSISEHGLFRFVPFVK